MKKVIFSLVALCLIGMCSMYAVSLPGSPIVFVDIYAAMPCDDAEDGNGGGGRPDPNRVIGTIGIGTRQLRINVGDNHGAESADVVVVNSETGAVVVDESFVGQTSIDIPAAGAYTAYVSAYGTTFAGAFEVE